MYTKQIGRFSIVADNKPDLKGYFTPSGTALRQEDIWKDNVFYEQDYFSIYTLQNLRVLDDNQKICTPIIDEIEVQNRGYVCTWSAVFWVQGFAIVNDEILFISLGEDTGYLEKKKVFNKLIEYNID